MGELILPDAVAKLTAKNKITPEDVLMLRSDVFQDGVVSPREADALFAIDNSVFRKCIEWDEFFVEAMSDFVIRQAQPYGYVTEDLSRWLIAAISRDGRVATRTELELLITVIEKAESTPATLSAYALRQVADAVIEGEGPLAKGRLLERGVIGEAEVELLRRVLYGFAGGANMGITQDEAEILFILNDRTIEALNHESWTDLFVKAVANFMLCASGYQAPTREEALQREMWMNNTDIDLKGFFKRMVDGGVSGIIQNYIDTTKVQASYNRRSEERLARERLLQVEKRASARWLAERIGQHGFIHQNERALIDFLRENNIEIHPEMNGLFSRVA